MMDLEQALALIARHRTDEIVVTTMSANLIWPAYSTVDADLMFTAPMGGAPGVALGIAMARPDSRVWVINGDGSTSMYLGSLIDIAGVMPPNLVFFLMDNREWGRVGHLSLPAADRLDFAGFAQDAGWKHVHTINNVEELEAALHHIKEPVGPVFVDLRVTTVGSSKDKQLYAERMGRLETKSRYGKSGVEMLRAYLAQRRSE